MKRASTMWTTAATAPFAEREGKAQGAVLRARCRSHKIAALDALDLLVVVDNESDTLSSVDKGVSQLPELGRLVARVPHLAPKDGAVPPVFVDAESAGPTHV